MSLFFLPLLPLAVPYILGGLDFLREQLFPPAPSTSPVGEPFTPPFTGGQCAGDQYDVVWKPRGQDFTGENGSFGSGSTRLTGKIEGTANNNGNLCIVHNGGIETLVFQLLPPTWQNTGIDIISVSNVSNPADPCGNLQNPNPSPSIAADGIGDSVSPDIDSDGLKIVEGAPLANLPNFAAALAAALAAAKAAADALSGIRAIADALDLLKPLLEKINEDAEDKDKDGKKDYIRYQFGAISADGFLRLYPSSNLSGYKAEQIDINILSIPIGYGKYFGNLSPNFYRFKELGYIAFVSPTFGIIEFREIEFSRMSLTVPEGAIGFYYHLGLDGAIVGNAWGYYSQKQE